MFSRIPDTGATFVAASPATARVVEAINRVAATDVRVLLGGELGVGKGRAAWCVHRASARSVGRFARLPVCVPGALTLLGDRSFALGLAGGTVVFEGVDEASAEVQAALTGWIETWASAEEGAEAPVRVVATVRSDPFEAVERGLFRPDLYFLLDVFPIWIPPLRNRRSEIPALIDHFCGFHGHEGAVPAPNAGFLEAAMAHGWPGNVRELENLVTQVVSGAARGWDDPRVFPGGRGAPPVSSFASAKKEFEGDYVRRLLLATGGNVTRASRLAGKARKDFYALMARSGVDPARFRPGGAP